MPKETGTVQADATKEELEAEITKLQQQIHRLKTERDALEKSTELLKKAGGINLIHLQNAEKAEVIDAQLVNSMLEKALANLRPDEHPIIHSDRGCHYRWPDWIQRVNEAGLVRSMSKKGCSPDNSACEGFFGRLKNEMFYGRSWHGVSLERFMKRLDDYIHWYNEKRIKLSLGGMSPVEHRRSLGLI